MNGNRSAQDEAMDIASRGLVALDWFKSNDPRASRGRLALYRRIAQRYLAQDTSYPINRLELLCLSDLRTMVHIYEWRNQLKCMADFEATLRRAIGGSATYGLDQDQTPRNFLFQLECAVTLLSAGANLLEHETGDLEASVAGINVLGECKRLSSDAQLERRVREGIQQISNRREDGDEKVGLVFVDVTTLANKGQNYWNVQSEDDAQQHWTVWMRQWKTGVGTRLTPLSTNKHMAGAMCRLQQSSWTDSDGWVNFQWWLGIPNPNARLSAAHVLDYLGDRLSKTQLAPQ